MSKKKDSPEFRATVAREVIERSRPIADAARENGLIAQTLGNRVSAYQAEHQGEEPPLTESAESEKARVKQLEDHDHSALQPMKRTSLPTHSSASSKPSGGSRSTSASSTLSG